MRSCFEGFGTRRPEGDNDVHRFLCGHKGTACYLLWLDSEFCRQLRLRYHRDSLPSQVCRVDHHRLQPDSGIRPVCLIDNLLELVMCDDVQPAHRRHPGSLAAYSPRAFERVCGFIAINI